MNPDNDMADGTGHEPDGQALDESAAGPRALSRLTCELRERGGPSVDLDALEARLFARLEAGEGPRSPLPADEVPLETRLPPRRSAVVRLLPWVSLVAAAAVALFFFSRRGAGVPSPMAQPQVQQRLPVAVRLPGVRVEAASAPRSFSHEGLASWRLDAGTVAMVSERPDHVTLTLEKGAVEVDVVPNQPFPERFVVVAGKTRVAVRGTRFRVALAGDRVELDVEHGLVAVSSTDRPGEAPAFLVSGPGGGSFGLDGDPAHGAARLYRAFGATGIAALPQASQAALPSDLLRPPPSVTKPPSAPAVRADPGAAVGAGVGAGLGAGKPEEGVDAALRARLSVLAADCFERGAHVPPNVSVTVATTLSVEADAGGVLSAPRFSPPLAPAVEACFREGLAVVRGPSGKYDIPLSLAGRR